MSPVLMATSVTVEMLSLCSDRWKPEKQEIDSRNLDNHNLSNTRVQQVMHFNLRFLCSATTFPLPS
jgi:hypothetical protein